MYILHVLRWKNQKFNGVMNVVPYHVKYQNRLEHTEVFNDGNEILDNQKEFNVTNAKSNIKKQFNELLIKTQPDIVIFHEFYILNHVKCANLCKKHNIPYIIVPHGSLTYQAQNKKRIKKLLGNYFFFNNFLNNASCVHYLSKGEYKNSIYKDKYFISPNGMVKIKCKLRDNYTSKKFLYIGRIDIYHKGLDLLLQAITEIKDLFINSGYKIELYGPGKKNDILKLKRKIEENKLDSIIEIHNGIYGNDKLKILKNAKYFIQTSRFEGLPLSLLEAMSFGIPVLATSGCFLDEEIESYHCGFHFNTSISSIKENIIKAVNLDEDNYYKMRDNAIKLIKDYYDWNKITLNIINKYKQIINDESIV